MVLSAVIICSSAEELSDGTAPVALPEHVLAPVFFALAKASKSFKLAFLAS